MLHGDVAMLHGTVSLDRQAGIAVSVFFLLFLKMTMRCVPVREESDSSLGRFMSGFWKDDSISCFQFSWTEYKGWKGVLYVVIETRSLLLPNLS